jgi:ArsR family transcriptional regulator
MASPRTKKKPAPIPKTLPPGALELIAARFRLLAEPMRLRLLNELRGGERTVSDLVTACGAGQANVSKHLGLLADAGMVGRRKDGLNVFYFIADESLFALCDLVCARLQAELSAKASALNA